MTIRTAALLLILVGLTAPAHAQLAKNGAYFELGGSGIVPTLNYERQVRDRWFARMGFSYVQGETTRSDGTVDRDNSIVVPLTVSWIGSPASSHHLELGGGVTIAGGDRQDLFAIGDEEEQFSAVIPTGLIGYRYQPPGRHFQFRAVGVPVFDGGSVLPWAGVSFGYSW